MTQKAKKRSSAVVFSFSSLAEKYLRDTKNNAVLSPGAVRKAQASLGTPASARALLKRAGIVTSTGRLAKHYR